ncbi:GAF domain-containing protein [Exiguobacterium sp. s28]|uniref:GAF domain-containing protein n=1 Tax=Exiguobacterium sp. s28 TaxID=2751238 RepID=UPI001BEB849C
MFALLIGIDLFFSLGTIQNELNLFYVAAILFALRYGTIFGLISFGILLLYKVLYTGLMGGDIFLLFYDTNSLLTLFYYFAITVIVGLFSTSFRERYEISQFRNEELKDENTYLKETVDLLNTSQTTLRQKLLQSEYSLNQLYELAVSLDLPHPELIRSETIRLLKKTFLASDVAIYHVDRSQKSMRLLIRQTDKKEFPQTIFLDEASSMFKRFFQVQETTLRQLDDEDTDPMLLAPIIVDGMTREVVVIKRLPLRKLTTDDLHVLNILFSWIGTRIQNAENLIRKEQHEKMHKGTSFYKKTAFTELVAIQEQKKIHHGQPYIVLEYPLGYEPVSLESIEAIVHSYLREIDVVGYDPDENKLVLLLPGTSEEHRQRIYDRIEGILIQKGV